MEGFPSLCSLALISSCAATDAITLIGMREVESMCREEFPLVGLI